LLCHRLVTEQYRQPVNNGFYQTKWHDFHLEILCEPSTYHICIRLLFCTQYECIYVTNTQVTDKENFLPLLYTFCSYIYHPLKLYFYVKGTIVNSLCFYITLE
jgi:hypothetical protein